ncbi:glycerophosphodiester phosphodiesterase family protein [Salinarimonas soli]|uniref:Glycerophosphodiester phosphodiesterase n=1 Tax=Salinarimonas soli TaxID=1638099 RepID=A0A5B2W0K3_9HYPH|nr:glycerophosphodiester phosphodiesterase family protein [Salinarimonas soli]KAA2243947.1 glycerophosphodiester phosphodiesterase [Salinarimonas soli]
MSAPDWLVAQPIAHRGLHERSRGVIENTITAVRAAIAHGFAIECDVQDSSDGEAMIFHDYTLERLTGESGAVRERRADALAAIAISGSTSDRIPTLATFLDEIAGRVPLVVEIKSRYDGDMTLTRRTVEIVSAHPGPVAIKTFDPAVLAEVRRLAPGIPRGIVAEAHYEHPDWRRLTPKMKHAMANLLHFAETEPDFVSWRVADLPHAAPHLSRLLGRRPVMTWTVRTDEDRRRAAEHADQMVFEGFVP